MRFGSLLAASILLAFAVPVQAQVVVVSAGSGRPDPGTAAELATAAEQAGFDVFPAATVRDRTGLAPVGPVPADLKRDLGQAAETALELVASGEGEQAVSRGGSVLERAEEHLAAVGADSQTATDLANLCLYLVRAELSAGEDAAAARARTCWRMVPDLPVDERLHPPNVRQLVGRVRSDIDGGRTVLSLRAAPGAPSGCAILLNGRPVGETPEVRRAVVPGTYSVAASCEEGPAVARTVSATENEPQRVVVHPRLESALRFTEGGPWLVYPSDDEARERAAADAGELARLAGLSDAVVAVRAGSETRLMRVAVEPSGPARVVGETTTTTDAAQLQAGLTRLRQGGPAVAVAADDAEGGTPIVGPVLLGTAGLGALAVLTVGLLSEGCVEEGPDGTCLQERSLNTTAAIAYGAAGGAAIVGAILWLVLGGGSDADVEDEDAVDVAVGLGNVDVSVTF